MGLDMRPMGKPKPGFEARYAEIFELVEKDDFRRPSFLDRLLGRTQPTKEELVEEWFANQIPTYETIRAPRVGRDKEADDWILGKYEELEEKPSIKDFLIEHEGFYVIELAPEKDGVPVYIALGQDGNVFRGQFLTDCIDILGEELVNEAWETKLASAALDYGNRILSKVDSVAQEQGLEYLRKQRMPPESDETAIESKLHIAYSLAKWLIFYGQNGHGYEADY